MGLLGLSVIILGAITMITGLGLALMFHPGREAGYPLTEQRPGWPLITNSAGFSALAQTVCHRGDVAELVADIHAIAGLDQMSPAEAFLAVRLKLDQRSAERTPDRAHGIFADLPAQASPANIEAVVRGLLGPSADAVDWPEPADFGESARLADDETLGAYTKALSAQGHSILWVDSQSDRFCFLIIGDDRQKTVVCDLLDALGLTWADTAE